MYNTPSKLVQLSRFNAFALLWHLIFIVFFSVGGSFIWGGGWGRVKCIIEIQDFCALIFLAICTDSVMLIL